jgi:mannosyltransferase OCH1-like enzyme
LIVREKGGIYLDSDFYIIRDFEAVLSQYSEIFTLERIDKPLIANNFFASIPYGPVINAIYD